MQKKTIISAILVFLILLAGVLYWAFNRGIFYFEEGSAIPKFSRSAITNPVPALGRSVEYPEGFPEEGKAIHANNVAQLTAKLSTDPQSFEAWLDLAIYYRMVNDHTGAVEIWEYLLKQYPQDGISRHNLGEYYFHNEKDYPKAEAYYEESIKVMPSLESNYSDMYEMYKYVYKQDTEAAIDILKRGIKNLTGPSAIQLTIMLGREYRDRGDKANAKKFLTEARDAAQAAGDRSVASDLTREISSL